MISIERNRRSNQSNQIERNRPIEIWLSNAIESQSNITAIFRFDWYSIAFDCVRSSIHWPPDCSSHNFYGKSKVISFGLWCLRAWMLGSCKNKARRSQSNGIDDRTSRTKSNAIDRLKFDCRTQSNLIWVPDNWFIFQSILDREGTQLLMSWYLEVFFSEAHRPILCDFIFTRNQPFFWKLVKKLCTSRFSSTLIAQSLQIFPVWICV